MTGRRRRSGPSRCNRCGVEVVWFSLLSASTRRPFIPKPVSGRDPTQQNAYPVWSGRAWKRPELVAELMSLHKYREVEAVEEMRDLPHHRLHLCGYPTPDVGAGRLDDAPQPARGSR